MYGAFSQLYLGDLEEQRGGEEREGFKNIIWRMGRRVCVCVCVCVCVFVYNFYEMQLTTLDIMLTIFNLVIALSLIDDVNHHMHLFLTCTYSGQFQTFLVCH